MSQTSTPILTAPPRALPSTLLAGVDDEDIALGQRRNGRERPIARATRRTLWRLGYWPAEVVVGSCHFGYSTVSISFGDSGRIYNNDQPSFVTAFDHSGSVAPCTVTLVAS